jgi:hypothetical protein
MRRAASRHEALLAIASHAFCAIDDMVAGDSSHIAMRESLCAARGPFVPARLANRGSDNTGQQRTGGLAEFPKAPYRTALERGYRRGPGRFLRDRALGAFHEGPRPGVQPVRGVRRAAAVPVQDSRFTVCRRRLDDVRQRGNASSRNAPSNAAPSASCRTFRSTASHGLLLWLPTAP